MIEGSTHPTKSIKFISRKASLNIEVASPQKCKKKDKYSMEKEKNQLTSERQTNYSNKNLNIRKQKVCDGERLFRQVTSQNSRQKRDNFLTRYARDPFMRKKMDLSIKKYSNSKPAPPQDIPYVLQKKYTTFRQQSQKQTLKTYQLINNCKSLMEELKKTRALKNPQNYHNNRRNMFLQKK